MHFLKFFALAAPLLLGQSGCKHQVMQTRSEIKANLSESSPRDIILWTLNAKGSDADEAKRGFKEFSSTGQDQKAAAVLRYYFMLPERWDQESADICGAIMANVGMKATGAACETISAVSKSNLKEEDPASLTPDALKTWSDGDKARLLAEMLVKPEDMVSRSKDPQAALNVMLSHLDSELSALQSPLSDLGRGITVKNMALAHGKQGPMSRFLNAGSWSILENQFFRTYQLRQNAVIASSGAIMNELKEARVVSGDSEPRSFFLSSFLPSTEVSQADGNSRTDVNDTDTTRFFGILVDSMLNYYNSNQAAQRPLVAIYENLLQGVANKPAEGFSRYNFKARDEKRVRELVANLGQFSELFHRNSAAKLGCSSDNLMVCPPLVSFYRSFLPQLMASLSYNFSNDSVQADACQSPSSASDPLCQRFWLFGVLNDASALKAVLPSTSNPQSYLLPFAQFVSSKKVGAYSEAVGDLSFTRSEGASSKTGSMIYLCLAFFDNAGQSPFDSAGIPKRHVDSIYFTTRLLFALAGNDNSDSSIVKYRSYIEQTVPEKAYCIGEGSDEMPLADPARYVQEQIVNYVQHQGYFPI